MEKRFFGSLRVLVGVAGLAAIGALADGQITRSGDSYKLRMKHVKGATAKYTMSTAVAISGAPKGSGTPGNMNATAELSTKVLSVNGDKAKVEYTVVPKSGQMMGAGTTKQTLEIDSRGKLVGGNAGAMASFASALPKDPVKVGQSWTESVPLPTQMGKMSAKATYKLVGFRTEGGKNVADISVAMSGGGDMMTFTGSGTLRLRVDDGSMQSASIKQVMKMTAQKGMTVNVNVALARK